VALVNFFIKQKIKLGGYSTIFLPTMRVPPETLDVILGSILHTDWTVQLMNSLFTVSTIFREIGLSALLKHLCICAEETPRTLPVPGYEMYTWFLVSHICNEFPVKALGSRVRHLTLYITAPEQMDRVKTLVVRLEHVNRLDILMSPISIYAVVCGFMYKCLKTFNLMHTIIASMA
jgi:hypothetical protein